MTQAELAAALGFKDRQTLSQIEVGDRKLGFQEMVRAAEVFGVGIDYFTDPFELAGEGRFSWRQTNADAQALDTLEHTAGRWIAAFRYLARLRGDSIHSSLRRVALTPKSSFEDAIAEGEAIGATLDLGDIPSARLAESVQERLDTLVLYVDTVRGVSGAACQLDQLNVILINRREPVARRSYDLAHELFHLLTWHTMPPKHVESDAPPIEKDEKRVEQLAESFAAGLLMPTRTINALLGSSAPPNGIALAGWIRGSALRLGVSGPALKWRLVNMGVIKQQQAIGLPDNFLLSISEEGNATPARYSRRFVSAIAWGIDEGHVSARRVAQLLETSVDDLRDLFTEHGLSAPFDL
jgi:Zn-dependent peptidase ImmA (M78 family)/transcriptional regulator with XRE-family HTH domain